MREVMTKTMARNVFYGGSLFFIVVFLILSAHSVRYVVNQSTANAPLTDSVRPWQACVGKTRLRELPHNYGGGCVLRA